MQWYYVEAGQQAGPVEEAVLDDLVRTGRVQPDTLVWREGMPSWQPYQQARPAVAAASATEPGPMRMADPAAAGSAPGADQVVCAECRGTFPRDSAIQFGTTWVCAACKPIFVQKLREGVAATGVRGRRVLPVDPDQLIQEVVGRGVNVDIGSCVSRGWALYKANFGIVVGATFLVMLIIWSAQIVKVVAFISLVFFQGPLMGGLNRFYLKLIRGENATLGDAFSGFSDGYGRFCRMFVLMTLLIYGILICVGGLAKATHAFNGPGVPWGILGFGLLGCLVMFYLSIAFCFALPLCADLELGPWNSLRVSFHVAAKQWWQLLGLTIVAGLCAAVGFFAFCIGLLFTMPLFSCIFLHAYEDVFGVPAS